MKIKIIFSALYLMMISCSIAYGQPHVDIGASFGPEGLKGFFFAIHEHFRIPEREVVMVRERRVPEDEIPVVFFIAQRARVVPNAVIDLRLSGKSWMDIIFHFGLSPEIFYVPVKVEVKGPPYGKAYGYYKNKPKKEWKHIKLVDADIINFVNLKFLSEYHKWPPEEVIKMRSEGKHFVTVNEEIKKGKQKKFSQDDKGKGKEKRQGEGKGKGKGRN